MHLHVLIAGHQRLSTIYSRLRTITSGHCNYDYMADSRPLLPTHQANAYYRKCITTIVSIFLLT